MSHFNYYVRPIGIENPSHFGWLLTLFFVMVVVLANWFVPKLINIFGVATNAGALIFPLTFLLAGIIIEVYGYAYAQRAIGCGLLFNVLFIAYSQLVIHIPSPVFATNNILFDSLLVTHNRTVLAALISYLSSQPINAWLLAKLKAKMDGRLIMLRFSICLIIAITIESLVLNGIAFYGIKTFAEIVALTLNMEWIKIVVGLALLPLAVSVSKKILVREKFIASTVKNPIAPPRCLWFLMLAYAMVLVSANWFDARLISLAGLNAGAGAVIFPLTFLLADLITEVYGYKNARLAIWTGFLFNLVFLIYGQIIIHLPTPDAANNMVFAKFLHAGTRIILASAITYLLAEPFNSYLLSKLKIGLSGKFVGLRFVTATLLALAVNTVMFCLIAFYGTMSNPNFGFFMLTSWIFMATLELLLLPVSVQLAYKLKAMERMDIYDDGTNFNFFSLNTLYKSENNHYKTS